MLLALALAVSHDLGGSLLDRKVEVIRLRRTGAQVRILGTCGSACTMYLGLPGTCVSPDAKLLFHGPGSTSTAEEAAAFAEMMARHYPAPLADWFRVEWQRINYDRPEEFSGAEMIALGINEC